MWKNRKLFKVKASFACGAYYTLDLSTPEKENHTLHYNWSWLWTETSCEFLLWFCTTPPRASQKIAHFPFVYEVVHIMEPVITMDNGNEKLFTFSSLKSSGRLANYIRAFCHFLFCSFPATNIIKENNRISFRKNTTIHSIPASLTLSRRSSALKEVFSFGSLSPSRFRCRRQIMLLWNL